MPYKDLAVRRAYHRRYQRVYMPIWRKKHPRQAARIAAKYDKSAKRTTVEKRRNQKPARKQWRKLFDAVRGGVRRAGWAQDWRAIVKIYDRAAQWREWGFDVVVDHVIPLARGGKHSSDNLQIIYRTENRTKGAKLNYHTQVVFL